MRKFIFVLAFSLGFSETVSADSSKVLQAALVDYFDASRQVGENFLRQKSTALGEMIFEGTPAEIRDRMEILPELVRRAVEDVDHEQTLFVLKVMLLDEAIQSRADRFNQDLSVKRRWHKFGWTAGAIGLGVVGGLVIMNHASRRPDGWSAAAYAVLGAGALFVVPTAGGYAVHKAIDNLRYFQGIDPVPLDFVSVNYDFEDLDFSQYVSRGQVGEYLSGAIDLDDFEKALMGDVDWSLHDYLKNWPQVRTEMTQFILYLEEEDFKIAATSRALRFQRSLQKRIEEHNQSRADAAVSRRLISAVVGGGAGAALGFWWQNYGSTVPKLELVTGAIVGGIGGTVVGAVLGSVGYRGYEFILRPESRKVSPDFNVIDLDLLLP